MFFFRLNNLIPGRPCSFPILDKSLYHTERFLAMGDAGEFGQTTHVLVLVTYQFMICVFIVIHLCDGR